MSTHTPAPWAICDGPSGYEHRIYSERSEKFEVVCEVVRGCDARLLAAAPYLLDALLALRDAGPNGATHFTGWHESYANATWLARKAIALATGEGA